MLRLRASIERASEHPLARAIVLAATERGIALAEPEGVDSPVGKGVLGRVEGRAVLIGNARFLAEHDVDVGALDADADALRRDGATAIFVAVDGRAAGVFGIADPVKASTPAALAALQGGWRARDHADRRQPQRPLKRLRAASASPTWRLRCYPTRKAPSSRG